MTSNQLQHRNTDMKLIRGPHPFTQPTYTVATIGNFDGIHIGHQKLIQQLLHISHQCKLPSVLLTFEPHPQDFFSPNAPTPRLMRFREKWKKLLPYSIDYLYCLRFHAALANQSPEQFVEKILVNALHIKAVVIGDDFRFGAKRQGDTALLKTLGEKFGFAVHVLPEVIYQDKRVSSSRVREALKQGDFDLVYALTGGAFFLSGKIIGGEKRGRQLGFPTANIFLHRKQTPLMGIFVARVFGIAAHPIHGVASIGYRPTFNGKNILLEVHLFDFNQHIYGQQVSVEFLKKIREEEKFNSSTELIQQMEKDVYMAKDYFKSHSI